MIEEVLLALSGHPSSLCTAQFSNTSNTSSLVTPAEKTLLLSVGRLGDLHRALRSHVQYIRQSHPSIICKAVANTLLSVNLSKFQQHIETVERNILLKDASRVGAYNIVPLASIVQEFDEWKRLLEWYWKLACFISPVDKPIIASQSSLGEACTGPALLNRLSSEMETGYEDIEEAATQLLVVGEQAFMRITSCWLLTGKLPDLGHEDFFVRQKIHASNNTISHSLEKKLIPTFTTAETASSILFIGRTLKMLEPSQSGNSIRSATKMDSITTSLMANTMSCLRTINYPIKSALLAASVTTIRKDLSRALGNSLLPMHSVLEVINHIRDFFLVGRPDFTDHLIEEADKYLDQRYQQTKTSARSVANTDLVGITMKATEVRTVMSRTWAAINSSSISENLHDAETEWAQEHLSLALLQSTDVQDGLEQLSDSGLNAIVTTTPKFGDFLLATPIELKLNLDSTFDLFLSLKDRQVYSSIHAYLVAIRRSHNHTSRLWKDGAIRKTVYKKGVLHKRGISMRKIWHTCTAIVSTLSEIGSFFSTEVVEQSWTTFYQWAVPHNAAPNSISQGANGSTSEHDKDWAAASLPHDLETLGTAHHQYLRTLAKSLLLADESWTRNMRNLLTYVDSMVAFVSRLQRAQQSVELYRGNVEEQLYSKYVREEEFLFNEAKKTCARVEDAISKLIDRLKHMNFNEIGTPGADTRDSGFEPWQPGNSGVEKLLLRLDMRPEEDMV